ncbi:hypothetical protein D3C81_694380 [compost metagenome]
MGHRKCPDHIDHHMDLRIRQPVVISLYDLDHGSPTLSVLNITSLCLMGGKPC